MPVLGFWGWCKLILTLLPTIVKLVKRFIVFKDGVVDYAATKDAIGKYLKAVDKAIATGDTSDVEAIFNPRR